jgi:hypothetical protein
MRPPEALNPPTYRSLSCDSLEVRLAYSLLLQHAEARELTAWGSDGGELVSCALRSGVSDLRCLLESVCRTRLGR